MNKNILNERTMNIAIAINHRYVRYTYVMLNSLFMYHTNERLKVFVLNTDLDEADKACLGELAAAWQQEIVFYEVNIENYMQTLPTTDMWTKEMYYRLLIGELLPQELERILYMDVDVIINGSLSEMYFMDMQGNELAAADDTEIQGNYSEAQEQLFADMDIRYFNSGVLLYNLPKIRANYKFADYYRVAEAAEFRLSNPDQDLLNYVHAGKVLYLDNNLYNAFSQNVHYEEELADIIDRLPHLIHFAGRKPWNYNGVRYDLEKLWWIYAKETPFYQELMEEVFWDSFTDNTHQTIIALLKENKDLKDNLEKAINLCQKLYGQEGSR